MPATHGGRKTSYQTRIRGLNVLWSQDSGQRRPHFAPAVDHGSIQGKRFTLRSGRSSLKVPAKPTHYPHAALLVALRSPRLDVFASREDLERAWKERTFP